MPTRKITRVGRKARTGVVHAQTKESESASLVDLLNAVQQSNLEFLPVSPQKGLGILGRGLSGLVHQSTADISTVLVFKEGIPSKRTCDTEQDQDWYSLVTEVAILQHPPLKANPHIIDLLGLAFSVSSQGQTQRAWPLLVTSKVNRGDLTTILRDEDHQLLSTESRMMMFAELTEALFVLHSCGVTHGDLKTDNILIQASPEEELNLLLIDFGSSAISGQTRTPTKSEPWNAPELDFTTKNLDHDELVQLDLYSFGLICLHLLLPLRTLADAGLFLIRTSEQTDDQWLQILSDVKREKAIGNLERLVSHMFNTIENAGVTRESKEILRVIVEATIRSPPGERKLPWQELLPCIQRYLSDSYHSVSRSPLSPPPLAFDSIATDHSKHREFNALGELDDTDYALPVSIYEDLLCKVDKSTCDICRRQYAFLISVCSIIGFGCHRDLARSGKWLRESSRTEQDLAHAIEAIGQQYIHPGRVSSNVLDALSIGVLVSSDRTQEYRTSRRLEGAESALKKRMEARELVFGISHLCLAKPAIELSQILEAQSRLTEAEVCLVRASEILENHLGERHPSALTTKVNLASLLARQGSVQEAEKLVLRVVPVMEQVLGAEHPETVTTQQILATIQFNLGKYNEARKLMIRVVDFRTKGLTSTHPLTVRAELTLASVMRAQGRLDQSRALLDDIDTKLSGLLVGDNLTRAQLSIVQAMLHKDAGVLEEAFQKINQGLSAMDRLRLPANDALRLDGLEILASIHGSAKDRQNQEAVLRQVLQLKGGEHERDRESSTTRCLLAESLRAQFKLDEAWSLANEVLVTIGQSIGQDPENYVTACGIKADVLAHRGQLDEARTIRQDLLERVKVALGESNTFTLIATYSLGVFCADQGENQKAQQMYELALAQCGQDAQPGIEAIKVKRLLAIALAHQGEFGRSEIECQQGIAWAIESLGECHGETIALRNALGNVYILTDQFTRADELYSPKFQEQSVGTEAEPYVLEHLAVVRKHQQRLPEAFDLKRRSEALLKSALGEYHPEFIRMQGNVLSDYMDPDYFTDSVELEVLSNIARKKTVFGIKHPSTVRTMCDLAYAYSQRGRIDEANVLFQEIWNNEGVKVMENPSERAKVLGKRANNLFQLGRFAEAEALEQEALEIRINLYGDTHGSVLINMRNLASTLAARGNYEEAEGYLRHVITAQENALQPTARSVCALLSSMTDLGAVLYYSDQLDESAHLFTASIATAEHLGLPSSTVAGWKEQLIEVQKKANNNGTAPVIFSPD